MSGSSKVKNGTGFRVPNGFARPGGTCYTLKENPGYGCQPVWPSYYAAGGFEHFATEWFNSGLTVTDGTLGTDGIAWVTCPSMPNPFNKHQYGSVHVVNAGDFVGNPNTGPGVLLWGSQNVVTGAITAYVLMVSNTFSIPPAAADAPNTINRFHILKYAAPGPVLTPLLEIPVPALSGPFTSTDVFFEAHIVPVGGTNAGQLKLEGVIAGTHGVCYVDPLGANYIPIGKFGVICFGSTQRVSQFIGRTYADGTDGILSTDF